MQKGKVLKTWELAMLLSLCLGLLAGTWAEARHKSISSSLVRLHVLAHSDSPYEQALKLYNENPLYGAGIAGVVELFGE